MVAKVFTQMELLEKGAKTAKKEHEKIDLINRLAEFGTNSGLYFKNDEYFEFEDKVIEAIENGNSYKYKFSEFEGYYDKAIESFLKLKRWYTDLCENRINISYAFCSYGKTEKLIECLGYIFMYPRRDIEAVILDFATDSNLEQELKQFSPNRVRYFKGHNINEIENEMNLLSKCEGVFTFPINEEDLFVEDTIPQIIDIIYDNPQAGVILCPQPDSKVLTKHKWECLAPGDDKLELMTHIKYKTGFGYNRMLLNLKDYNSEKMASIHSLAELYTDIATKISTEYEIVLFCLPMYALEP